MNMLSNEDIKKVIASGELILEPYDEKYLRGAGLTLHLWYDLMKPKPGKVVDVKKSSYPEYESIRLTDESPYPLNPGEFILGATYQKVTVGSNLGFFIE